MKLMTKEIASRMPGIGSTDGADQSSVKVPLKLFDPCGRLTYYATEFDGVDTLFGYMVSPLGPDCDELGYASLDELSTVRNRFGLGIERDIHWDPETTLATVMSNLGNGGGC